MQELFYTDLQHFILIKLCLVFFVLLGIVCVYKRAKPIWFLALFGFCSAAAYYILVDGMDLMFWGMIGDENFIAALYEMAAHGKPFFDFVYPSLPAYYPPLFFLLFRLPGQWFDLNGIQLAKLATFSIFLLYPAFFYAIQKWYWHRQIDREDKGLPNATAWLVSALLLFALVDPDAVIIKQYEFVSASLSVLWAVWFLDSMYRKSFNYKHLLFFGVTGGLLFMTFYFWIFLAVIGLAIYNLFSDEKVGLKRYAWFTAVGLCLVLVALPYWFPLAQAYLSFGAENWQLGFTIIDRLKTDLPTDVFSPRGLAAFLGLASLLWFRKERYARSLLCLFVVPYIWQLMGYVSILFFASPLQESKGFMYFNDAVLALAVGYGIERLRRRFRERIFFRYHQHSISIILILLLAVHGSIFGAFSDYPAVHETRVQAKSFTPGIPSLRDFLSKQEKLPETVTLHSGILQLQALLPLNSFIYYNMHVSHPAARFSERLGFIEDMARSKSPEELHNLIKGSFFGAIDRFIFFNDRKIFYPIYFNLDDFPNGIKAYQINLPASLFQEPYFKNVYESDAYVVFDMNSI
ncbi:MAG: hypothetical protein HYY51_01590 [Candidatus Magasanikbacteria bacterium]|nr:hypothetical protein [Candidatus Magasanikbacteria bacterium]